MTETTKSPTALEMLNALRTKSRSRIQPEWLANYLTPIIAAFEREQAARDKQDAKMIEVIYHLNQAVEKVSLPGEDLRHARDAGLLDAILSAYQKVIDDGRCDCGSMPGQPHIPSKCGIGRADA